MTREVKEALSPYKHSQEAKTWHASAIQIQERAFTHWCNLFLKSKGFEIDNLLDLRDGVCITILLEILSGKNIYGSESDQDENDAERNWRTILNFLEKENIKVPQSPGMKFT